MSGQILRGVAQACQVLTLGNHLSPIGQVGFRRDQRFVSH